MTSDPAIQWAVTGLFAALSAHSLWRLATTRALFVALGYLLHLSMNLDMAAMAWPWWSRLPALPQLALFSAAAVYFAAAAGWYATEALPDGAAAVRQRSHHHQDARTQATHAAMMLAMVWAVAVMSRAPQAHHLGHGAGLGSWTTAGGAALAVGGTLFVVDAARHLRERGSIWNATGSDHLAGALMSFGMVAMCGLMLVV